MAGKLKKGLIAAGIFGAVAGTAYVVGSIEVSGAFNTRSVGLYMRGMATIGPSGGGHPDKMVMVYGKRDGKKALFNVMPWYRKNCMPMKESVQNVKACKLSLDADYVFYYKQTLFEKLKRLMDSSYPFTAGLPRVYKVKVLPPKKPAIPAL